VRSDETRDRRVRDEVRHEQVMTLHGDEELVTRGGHLFAAARTEFLCAARDMATWSQPEARASVVSRMRTGGPEFAVHKLLSPVALADEGTRAHLRQVRGRGAQVRISSSPLPYETILIDRRVMILAGQETAGGRQYTVTTSQDLVHGVHSLFSAVWDASREFDDYLREDVPHLDGDGRTILQSLASGLTDEAAARRLGVSLRTYRRRVAELMAALEAGSRFQAGLRAGELGLPH
jgi:DNA-binding NarL/FixJ family response regulator